MGIPCLLFDSVVETTLAGLFGNAVSVTVRGKLTAGVVITVVGTNVLIEYQNGVSTVTNVETAIAALAGVNDIIGVKTGGTGANILASNASIVDCDVDLGAAALDFFVLARNSGAAYDGTVLTVYGDSPGGGGVTATWAPVGVLGLGIVTVHFEGGVSTQAQMVAAINALNCPYYAYGGSVGAVAAVGNTGLSHSTGGGGAGDNVTATLLAGGSGYVAVTAWRGMKECQAIAHPTVGLYILTFRDRFPAFLAFNAHLSQATAAGYVAQIGAMSQANRTIEIRVLAIATGALTDPAFAAGDRINVSFMLSNTSAGRCAG
jgi:hypothetical protein